VLFVLFVLFVPFIAIARAWKAEKFWGLVSFELIAMTIPAPQWSLGLRCLQYYRRILQLSCLLRCIIWENGTYDPDRGGVVYGNVERERRVRRIGRGVKVTT
jgi:hypothetical protein